MAGLRFIEANNAYRSFQDDQTMRRGRRKEDLAAEANAAISGAISEEIANQTSGAQSGPPQPGQAIPPASQPQQPAAPRARLSTVTAGPAAAPVPSSPAPVAAPTTPSAVTLPPAAAVPPVGPGPTPPAGAPAGSSIPPDLNTRIAGRLASVGRRPGAVPGLGQAALDRYTVGRKSALDERAYGNQRADAATKRQDDQQRVALTALANGDDATFQHFSQKSGLRIPPAVLQNAKARSIFARGALVAEKFYKEDPAQAQKFVAAYVQAQGDPIKAFNAAGVPARKPNISVEHVIHGNQQVLGLLDKSTGKVNLATGPDGKPVQAVPKTTRGAGVPAEIQMRNWIVTNMKKRDGTAYTAEEADGLARTAKGNPETLAIRFAEAKSGIKDATTPSRRAQAQKDYDRFYNDFLQRYRAGGIAAGDAPVAGAPPASGGGENIPTYDPATGGFK